VKSRNDLNQFRSSSRLTNSFQVLRDGQWGEKDAVILVPGDIISVKLGDIIPADARLLEGDPLKIDQVEAISNVVDFGNFRKILLACCLAEVKCHVWVPPEVWYPQPSVLLFFL
jgi:hypothetical protein